MYKMEFVFTKKAFMRYISHLDLMRLLVRALRRSGIPVKMSEGFHPHAKLSIKQALKLGVESEHEEATVVLYEALPPQDFLNRMAVQLPEGISITSAQIKPI